MICDYCHGKTIRRLFKKHHWHDGRLYVVENVPAEICRQCGERYIHAKTLDAIDRLLRGDHPVKKKMQVEVVTLEAV